MQRNRIRRQMKAAVSSIMPNVKDGFNAVFIPRRHEAYEFADIAASIRKLLEKSGLLQ